MGRPYANELDRLRETVEFAYGADVRPLAALLADLVLHNLIFVGSGGSFTAASFAAALHEQYTGRLAKALTPLEASIRPSTTNTAAVLISARGSNPDIIKAFHSLCFKDPIAAICATEQNALLRQISDTGIGAGYGFTVPGGRDGFLATNSLLATLILLSRSYKSIFGLPQTDMQEVSVCPFVSEDLSIPYGELRQLTEADTIIALSSGWGWHAALDFESKCSESGLSNVLISDFRNFAHGRHNWLRTRAETTAVLSIEDKTNKLLADNILQLMPDNVQKIRLFSDMEGPSAGIELVSQVLSLVGLLGAESGVDPGRPQVARFGRKMYRRGFHVSNPRTPRQTWIARKADAIGLLPHENNDFLNDALDVFLERLRLASIKAIVADYDGTLCGTVERYTGLSERVTQVLDELMGRGLTLGVATGRGGSAHEDLRQAISSKYWDKVLLGLYNGGMILPLSDDYDDENDKATFDIAGIREALQPILARISLEMSQSAYQLSLRPSTPIDLERLTQSVSELLYGFDGEYQVRRSAHSVDVFCAANSKALLPRAIQKHTGVDENAILRIGDLGDWGGNDFDILSNGLSLSVDRVSSRLDSCWNLGLPGSRGVTTTLQYLRAVKASGDEFRLDVDSLDRRIRRGKS